MKLLYQMVQLLYGIEQQKCWYQWIFGINYFLFDFGRSENSNLKVKV